MRTIGETVRLLRRDRKLTQEVLSQDLGVSTQAVSKWENDGAIPDVGMLPVIADYFQISLDALFGRAELPVKPHEPFEAQFRELIYQCMAQMWGIFHGNNDFTRDVSDRFIEMSEKGMSSMNAQKAGIAAMMSGKHFTVVTPPEGGWEQLIDELPRYGHIFEALGYGPLQKAFAFLFRQENYRFTSASLVKQCQITREEAEKTIQLLKGINMLEAQTIDVDDQQIVSYHLGNMTIYWLLTIMAITNETVFHKSSFNMFQSSELRTTAPKDEKFTSTEAMTMEDEV